MTKFVRNISLAAVVAVVVVVGLSAFALAAPAAASSSAALSAHGGRGFCGEAGLAAAADALGLTTAELRTQLRAGESLADLADEAGVEAADVLAAVDTACLQAARDAIEQAVTNGNLTREHADWLLEGLDKGFWGPGATGRGFGPGFFGPRGGRGGHGGFGLGPDFGGARPTVPFGLDG